MCMDGVFLVEKKIILSLRLVEKTLYIYIYPSISSSIIIIIIIIIII